HVGVNDDAGQRFGLQLARVTLHRDIAKALEGEMGLEYLNTLATESVLHGLTRRAEILRVEVALSVQHLGVTERDRRPGGSLDAEPYPSNHVLAHVGHGIPSRSSENPDRFQLLDLSDRRSGLRNKNVLRVVCYLDTGPVAVVVSRFSPPVLFQPRI